MYTRTQQILIAIIAAAAIVGVGLVVGIVLTL